MLDTWKYLLFLCFVGLVTACSLSGGEESIGGHVHNGSIEWVRHTEWSAETTFPKWSEPRGSTSLFVGFVRPEHRAIPPSQRTVPISKYDIEAGKPFTTFLILKSGFSTAYPILVSIFLDYQQVAFRLDDKAGILHYLNIEPGADMEIPLEVPISTPGWHDLFVVVFRDPENHPTDPQTRLPPRFAVGGLRTVICAGDCTVSPRTLPKALTGQKTDRQNFSVYAYPLLPGNDVPPHHRLLLTAEANAGETFPLEVWAINPNKHSWDYIVIPLLDYVQTSFAGNNLIHLNLPPGTELFVTGDIRVPKESGVHELQFISIFDPYQSLESVRDQVIASSMRSALIVKGGN